MDAEEEDDRREVRGFDVRIGERWKKTDRGGRFRGKGSARGAIAVAPHDEEELYDSSEYDWGPYFIFSPEYVVLDGSGTYDVGDLALERWYNE